MSTVDALIVDLLEYVAGKERDYAEVIEAWHTSCPKLPVWEEANERGLVTRARVNGHAVVKITVAGAAFLERHRGAPRHLGSGP
jgi:D-3-phosphoglycerate dehydrogenase